MMIRVLLRLSFAVLLPVILATGCAGTSPRASFYTLGTTVIPGVAGTTCSDRGIALGPVNWPRYLDQPRIVVRTGANKLDFDEFHRWGGSLQDDFERALSKYLSASLQTVRIIGYRDAARLGADIRVEVNVRQFDGSLGGSVVLDAGWIITQLKADEPPKVYASLLEVPVTGQGYEGLVDASARAVAALGNDVTTELLRLCAS